MSGTLLIVDDDPVQRHLLEAMAQRFGFRPIIMDNGEDAVALLSQPARGGVDVLILDLVMPELDGFAVMERLRKAGVELPILVQTSSASVDTVVSAMRSGASDFLVKPVVPERFQISIRNAMQAEALAGEVRRVHQRETNTLTFDELPARSEAMRTAIALGQRAAATTLPVLIEAEAGSGKEVFARAIAASGERAGEPFVALNCGALAPALFEAVLFGGDNALIGMPDQATGRIFEADGGTLFLDAVDALPLSVQSRLLRALQDGEVDVEGTERPARVDVRIIAATHANLIDLVKRGRFREDLYYRLGVFPVGLPPLRARGEDIRPLARAFLARFAAEEGRIIRSISPSAFALLENHDWPGNVRQLQNAIFRAVVLAEGDELTLAEFPQIAMAQDTPAIEPARAPEPAAIVRPDDERLKLDLTGPNGHVRSLEDVERETIRHAVRHYEGQMTEVARRLKIGRSTLYRKMKELDLDEAACGRADTSASEHAKLGR